MQAKFGLIGHPIKHSMSPALFKAGYDGRYQYDLIEGAEFEDSYRKFLEEYHGINVTAPFKELAFAKAELLSEECRIIKATNLLVKTPEGVKAYNSDYLGVRMWLQEVSTGSVLDAGASKRTPPTTLSWAPPPAARGVARFSHAPASSTEPGRISVLICGCGGAGKAAAVAAASLGMRVIVMNRNMSKAEAVADSISQMPQASSAEVRPIEDFRDCFRESDIIIYNIPTAIPALAELSEEDFIGSKHILEANYKDPSFDNTLIDRAVKANPEIRFTKGSTWLLYQALTGYEIFTGEKPDLPAMTAVI